MSNTDTDFIILDVNPVYANQISEFIQCLNLSCLRFQRPQLYSRNVIDMDWGLVVKLALPAKVTRRANKVTGIYDRSH
jgi:hypothetical protein